MNRISTCRHAANPFWAQALRVSIRNNQQSRVRRFHTSQKLNDQTDQTSAFHNNEISENTQVKEQKPNVFHSLARGNPKSSQHERASFPSSKSSITLQERRVFENIRQKFGGTVNGILVSPKTPVEPEAKPSEQPPKALALYDLNVDNILSLFAPEISAEVSSENFEPMTAISQDTSTDTPSSQDSNLTRLASPSEVRLTARTVLQQISSNLTQSLRSTSPPAEYALWQYINAEIFPIVTLLQHPLLRPTANSFHRPYQLTIGDLVSADPENPLSLPTCLSDVPPQTPVLPLITILYPAATLLAMHNYAAHLPASDYALSLYPSIRGLGTTSFLLGANVHFFNSLMQLQWEVYSDIPEIAALLGDMRDAFVPYDARTLAILEAILVNGKEGRAKEWWRFAVQRGEIDLLKNYWLPKVQQSLKKNEEFVKSV